MFWPRVIAAPLWHSCSLDHLEPNEMWWGGIKGQSPPSLSPPTIPPFIPQSPAAQTIQSWAARYKVSPWTISFLEPVPGLTQESSQCQYDLVNISFSISQVLPCFKGLQLRTSLVSYVSLKSFLSLFLLMENKHFFVHSILLHRNCKVVIAYFALISSGPMSLRRRRIKE